MTAGAIDMRRVRPVTFLAGCWLTPALAAAPALVGPGNDPDWLKEAAKFLPDGYILGQVIAVSPDGSEAAVSVFPASANDPGSPGSAFDPGQVLDVRLHANGDSVAPVAGALHDREPLAPSAGPADRSEAGYAHLHREIWIRGRQSYPSGTEPCAIRGWSIDTSPDGLDVHLRPSPDSRLLGTLPPRYRFDGAGEAAPEEGFFTEFDIIGYRDGWFMIEHAEPPGRAYADPDSYPEDYPDPYAGRGWIPADRVGAQYANGDMPVRAVDDYGAPAGGLYQAPSIDAAWTPARNEFGDPVSADGGPKRILACSGLWALVESHDSVVGWWRRLCSNQVTNCS
jgi:hypothetical protein